MSVLRGDPHLPQTDDDVPGFLRTLARYANQSEVVNAGEILQGCGAVALEVFHDEFWVHTAL